MGTYFLAWHLGSYMCMDACALVRVCWGMLMCASEVAPDTLPSNTNTMEGPNFSFQNDADREGLYTAMEIIKRQTFFSSIVF